MWRATFSWHVEDMDLYGINFLHYGAPKTWYCVPPKHGHLLEKAARQLFPNVATWCSNFMRHKTCLISPQILTDLNVPFNKIVQEERDIIIVFPYAYHAGFNHGFNIAESTNFALERWIEYGKRHRPCDCSRLRVKIDMGIFVKRFQPEKYQDWQEGRDVAPHPEDPDDVVKDILLRAKDPEAYVKMVAEKFNSPFPNIIYHKALDDRIHRFDPKSDKFIDDPLISDYERTRFEYWKQNALEDDDKSKIIYDIYQHVEMHRIKIKVFQDTQNCSSKDLDMLREFLDRPDLQDVNELVQRDSLVKVARGTFA